MFDFINWSEYYDFFARGNPPLAFQLLAINTIFLVLLIIRKAGYQYLGMKSSRTLQFLLIISNFMIVLNANASSG